MKNLSDTISATTIPGGKDAALYGRQDAFRHDS
jgi:hypothetical protein